MVEELFHRGLLRRTDERPEQRPDAKSDRSGSDRDISVDLIAPIIEPGYQGNWKLKNAEVHGLGSVRAVILRSGSGSLSRVVQAHLARRRQ